MDLGLPAAVFAENRERLKRAVAVRIHPRLQSRIDASDVVQDALAEATARLPEYESRQSEMSPYVWLRLITLQRLALVHRQHLRVKARDARREVSLGGGHGVPEASSLALAELLLGKQTSPSAAVVRAEARQQVRAALDEMEPIDREVLTLRHFEQLTNGEVAQVLNLDKFAASKRYLRALRRIKEILQSVGQEFT